MPKPTQTQVPQNTNQRAQQVLEPTQVRIAGKLYELRIYPFYIHACTRCFFYEVRGFSRCTHPDYVSAHGCPAALLTSTWMQAAYTPIQEPEEQAL